MSASVRQTAGDAGTGGELLRVEQLSMRFGGLTAVNKLQLLGPPGRHHRDHRPERRRQDHRLQLHHRFL